MSDDQRPGDTPPPDEPASAAEDPAEERPWWASEDPAGHQGGDGSSHGEHTRPAWMDAMEALDGAMRAAARSARSAADRVTDVRDGLAGHVEGVPEQDAPGGDDGDDRVPGGGGGAGGGAGGAGGGAAGGPPPGHEHGAIDAYCHVCPVCALLRALEETRPEVLLHLTEAARHLTLAAKAVVDAQADRVGPETGFESIPVDD